MPWDEVVRRVQLAEELGFDGAWGFDHFQPMYGEGPGETFEGMTTLGFLDQTYFLLGLLPEIPNLQSEINNLKTLVMPGGLGSTHKVLILGKGVGHPALRGCSFKVRVT